MVVPPFISINTYMGKLNNTSVEFIETTSTKLTNAQEGHPGAFIHVNDENGDNVLYIGEDKVTDKFNVGDENLNSPTREVGGLNASTIGELKEKSVSEILLDILRPDVAVPTVQEYESITISYSGEKLIEVGTNLPNENDISVTIIDGVWSDGTPYAYGHDSVNLSINQGLWGEPAEEGIYTISGSVTFNEGGIPKDNFGTEYPNMQYHGGTKESSTITIKTVKPIYINNGKVITDMVKHIVDYLTGYTITVIIPAEVETPEPVKFKVLVPEQFSTFNVMQFNPLTQTYDTPVPMVFVFGDEPMYVREDNTYTNTTSTKYQINLKK